MLVCGVTIYTVPYLKCQEGNESLYPWVRSELDNWDQYQVVRLAAGASEGHLHPSLLNQQYLSSTHTTEGTHRHIYLRACLGYQTATSQKCSLYWTEPSLPFPFELFILLLWFQPFFHKVTTPFSVWILFPSRLPLIPPFLFFPSALNFPNFFLLFPFGLSYPSSLLRSWSAVFN